MSGFGSQALGHVCLLNLRDQTYPGSAGTKVTWVNHDEDAHTVTFQSNPKVASNPLQGNQSFSHTFQTAGTYSYICSIHPFMKGKVVVQ